MPLTMQYQEPPLNTWTAAGARLYVVAGTTVHFRVTSSVAGAVLATAQWNGALFGATHDATFAAASAGTGLPQATTVRVAFSGETAEVAVTVYRLTPTITPVSAMVGHHATNFGVGERMTLGFTTTPAGIAAGDGGGLRWELTGGVAGAKRKGTLQKSAADGAPLDHTSTSGTAYYIAPYITDDNNEYTPRPTHLAKAVRLTLAVLAGPCKAHGEALDITVLAPTPILDRIPGSDIHDAGEPSAGFLATIVFNPADVDFSALEFREASGALVATNCFKGWLAGWDQNLGGAHQAGHRPTIIGGAGLPVSRQNNRNEAGVDKVDIPYNPGIGAARYAGWDGTFTWTIYWQYRLQAAHRDARNPDLSWVRFALHGDEARCDDHDRAVTVSSTAPAVSRPPVRP